jgi:intracellular septation protein A
MIFSTEKHDIWVQFRKNGFFTIHFYLNTQQVYLFLYEIKDQKLTFFTP